MPKTKPQTAAVDITSLRRLSDHESLRQPLAEREALAQRLDSLEREHNRTRVELARLRQVHKSELESAPSDLIDFAVEKLEAIETQQRAARKEAALAQADLDIVAAQVRTELIPAIAAIAAEPLRALLAACDGLELTERLLGEVRGHGDTRPGCRRLRLYIRDVLRVLEPEEVF